MHFRVLQYFTVDAFAFFFTSVICKAFSRDSGEEEAKVFNVLLVKWLDHTSAHHCETSTRHGLMNIKFLFIYSYPNRVFCEKHHTQVWRKRFLSLVQYNHTSQQDF